MENYPKAFKSFLSTVEGTSESDLRKYLFMGGAKQKIKYLDSPGFYHQEKKDYEGIIDFYDAQAELEDWWNFYNTYPYYVDSFMRWYKIIRRK